VKPFASRNFHAKMYQSRKRRAGLFELERLNVRSRSIVMQGERGDPGKNGIVKYQPKAKRNGKPDRAQAQVGGARSRTAAACQCATRPVTRPGPRRFRFDWRKAKESKHLRATIPFFSFLSFVLGLKERNSPRSRRNDRKIPGALESGHGSEPNFKPKIQAYGHGVCRGNRCRITVVLMDVRTTSCGARVRSSAPFT
jgi:hypothetical protein